MTTTTTDELGPIAELGDFQRRRVRRGAIAAGVMLAVCTVLIAVSVVRDGVEIAFGPSTPVRVPILSVFAVVFLLPMIWSAIFRSHSYGLTLTEDALVVTSWWRTRTFERESLRSAQPGPAEMRISDGFFSGGGTGASPAAVWLSPSDPRRRSFPLAVTTGTVPAVEEACRRITHWLHAPEQDATRG